MITQSNFKMAIAALRANSWRSFLTMLGVIIGVMSVITIVSLGEGVRRQIINQIDERGDDLVTIVPGNVSTANWQGSFATIANGGTLSEADWVAAQQTQGVKVTAPFATVNAVPSVDGQDYADVAVAATTEDATEFIGAKVAHGVFIRDGEQQIRPAVIGRRVAERVFEENVPIGKSFELRGENFIVHGVFEETGYGIPIMSAQNFDNTILISYDRAKEVTGASLQIGQILVRPTENSSIEDVADNLRDSLEETRGSQANFSVLTPTEMLALTNDIVVRLTGLVLGIAAISLLVGGIGIMNIMLVSVSERTKEIGVRKAVGATNLQIMLQFLVEAIVLCLAGSVLGVGVAALVNFLIVIATPFEPVMTLPIIAVTVSVCLTIGVIFGLMPAARAARMAPIDALRYE